MSAFDVQIGGDHYKQFEIEPFEFCQKNRKLIGPGEASIIKYVSRHPFKNGKEDLLKARHIIDMIIELEYPDAK